MTSRPFLPITLTFALLSFGCRNSAKTTQVAPTPSPTPLASKAAGSPVSAVPGVPRPLSVPPAPAMSTLVPVKTFQVKPPAAFTADQIPQDEEVEFFLEGNAGQTLRVRAEQPFRLQVQAQLDGSSPLKFGNDSAGNWYYALPKTCAYRVLYAPWHTTTDIRFDFLPENDPRADPGIKPEQVEVDFGPFARSEELAIAPFEINEDSEDYLDSRPTYLAVDHRDFEFRIMTVAANKRIFKKYERMTAIEAAIRAHGTGADVEKLPYSVYWGGGVNLWSRPEYFEGEGWQGLRWIGSFSNGGAWCSPGETVGDLAYYFEGVSNDGQFFILLRSHLSSQELDQRFWKDCTAVPVEGRHIDDVMRDLNPVFKKDVRETHSASFQPNLDQLDAVIRSLKLR